MKVTKIFYGIRSASKNALFGYPCLTRYEAEVRLRQANQGYIKEHGYAIEQFDITIEKDEHKEIDKKFADF